MQNKKIQIIGILTAFIIVLTCVLLIIYFNSNSNKKAQMVDSNKKISIISPSGAPALSLVGILNDKTISLDYEIVNGNDVITAEFLNEDKDLIIAPINQGVELISKGANYQLLGVISWGNLYVVGNRNLYDGNIIAFGQNAIPGKVLDYTKTIMAEPNINVEYLSSVSDIAPLLINETYKAGLVAEPIKSKVLNSNPNLEVLYDLQDLYKEKTGYDRYPQAAIFVSNKAIKDKTQNILNICNVIDSALAIYENDSSIIINATNKIDFKELGFDDIDFIIDNYSKLALDFEYAIDCIKEIEFFFEEFDINYNDTMYVR